MTPNQIDIKYLQNWIGQTESKCDVITSALVDKFKATLPYKLWLDESNVPLGLHWCLASTVFDTDQLGQDGHPHRGGFLPPVPLPSRMWAGGEINFIGQFTVGDVVTRRSKITDVTFKHGKTGPLVFVIVEHEYWVDTDLIISERHDIVYKSAPPKNKNASIIIPQFAPQKNMILIDEVTLFRYSALTFNSHRIHYDRTYAQTEEGYEGLVVHGPLQATLLMNEAAKLCGNIPKAFSYRGVIPLIEQTPFQIVNYKMENGGNLWCEDFKGRKTMKSSYNF